MQSQELVPAFYANLRDLDEMPGHVRQRLRHIFISKNARQDPVMGANVSGIRSS